jgi:DNA-binding NarL/FixJ family response regulator
VRVALADDAAVLREGLARLLADAGIEVTAQVGTADELLEAVGQLQPDVAVVDIRMPPTWSDEGLSVAAEIHGRFPQVGVLVLSQYVDAEYALRLLDEESARTGYLLKERMLEVHDLVDALERVAAGETSSTRSSFLSFSRPQT